MMPGVVEESEKNDITEMTLRIKRRDILVLPLDYSRLLAHS